MNNEFRITELYAAIEAVKAINIETNGLPIWHPENNIEETKQRNLDRNEHVRVLESELIHLEREKFIDPEQVAELRAEAAMERGFGLRSTESMYEEWDWVGMTPYQRKLEHEGWTRRIPYDDDYYDYDDPDCQGCGNKFSGDREIADYPLCGECHEHVSAFLKLLLVFCPNYEVVVNRWNEVVNYIEKREYAV